MKLRIIPLGGLGEIGLNMMAFETEKNIVVADAGMMFPEDYMLGVDLVIPDMGYIRRNKDRVAGVVLTHAHEDHIGALPYLLRDVHAPVYGTPFTLGFIRHKLEEYDMLSACDLHEISSEDRIEIGGLSFEFLRVSHSTVDGVGFSVQTPWGRIVHTGDFKMGHSSADKTVTDINKLARWGEEGVLALMSDSTNVEREGFTISDRQVGEALDKLFIDRKGRVIVALFASNIGRIQQIVHIARSRGCKVVFNGRSIEISVRIAEELGYIEIPQGMEIDVDRIDDYPDGRIVIVTTGSQGEPMSALARMASGMHKQVRIKPGDRVILSSKFIPGNERAIAKIINNLYKRGADVIYEKISEVHVSGHAFREELKLMIRLTNPAYFIPIHGEYRHLTLHARLAEELGIPSSRILLAENGNIIAFDEAGARLAGDVSYGRVLVDGKGIGDVGKSVLKERRVMSEEGLVAVTMAFDEDTGHVVYGPEIISKGFVFETETGHLLEDAICVILEIVEDVGPDVPDRIGRIRARLQADLRRYFNFTIRRRPVILPFIMEI